MSLDVLLIADSDIQQRTTPRCIDSQGVSGKVIDFFYQKNSRATCFMVQRVVLPVRHRPTVGTPESLSGLVPGKSNVTNHFNGNN